jgi:uncharacterized protein (TIGR02117 family)
MASSLSPEKNDCMNKSLLIILLFTLGGCLGPVSELYPDEDELRTLPVYVISHGWHVGIAIESKHFLHKIPSHPQLPEAEYLKFGWGDNRYYPHDSPGFGLLLRAALLPTGSVIHVVGIDIPVENYFASSDVIQVNVTEDGMERLTNFVRDRFAFEDNAIIFATNGLYGNSTFFKAKGLYFIPKTSNTWTAQALRQTGAPITPVYAVTSGNVIYQARKTGTIIQLRN